jgi:FkbM family methyltransferase
VTSKYYHARGLSKAVGVISASEILLRRALGIARPVSVKVDGHRVEVRPTDSDLFVLSQVFGWEEYRIDDAHLAHLREIASGWQSSGIKPVIVDAGANVGYSTLYFASLFPEACVLAIEPDEVAFDILSRHVQSNQNIRPLRAALWFHEQGLRLQNSANGSWANSVSEGSGTPSRRLDSVLSSLPNMRPLIIKLDIEGAEREVVESCPEIFAEAKCIIVEPHDFMNVNAACLSPLYSAISGKRFDTLLSGENLILFAVV